MNLKLAGSETARWMLMDALGRICQSYTLPKATQSLNIDVSSLQPGVYWAVIYQGEKRDVRKLVINP
ncbi:MAG: T9SS type A sorting domain-containing protein [Saprospiraceae bacterium]|nr:T9SS type A sorting domain-containing protein [Saprospiraceae bacterium]